MNKCDECGNKARKVGTWGGLWIMACTRCARTWLRIVYAPDYHPT